MDEEEEEVRRVGWEKGVERGVGRTVAVISVLFHCFAQ